MLKKVTDAQRFGVAELRDGHVVSIEEKPKAPKSSYAVVGIYLYDNTVFEKIRRLKPSGRGELELSLIHISLKGLPERLRGVVLAVASED